MNKTEMIELVERYFAAVDAKDLEGTLSTCTPDCRITVETAGVTHSGRDDAIRTMFEGLFARFETLWHGDFGHVVDEEAGTIASQFTVRNLAPDGERQEKYNCNFFRVEDGRLAAISVYMMGPNTLT
jgi:ketosteroid isomerase-like protein